MIAEYWANGPNSETPPGHWHLLANAISDSPELVRRIGGTGPVVDRLEWDVKLYFALAAATHDAACAAWALKRHYSGARPITQIRYMVSKGQSSDAAGLSHHPEGLPLHPGVVEVITGESSGAGGRHEYIWDLAVGLWQRGALHLGKIAVLSWPGEHSSNPLPPAPAIHLQPLRWILARDWLPFQRKTFNTPAFPGYVSGHSTFSRAAAEVLTAFTGSAWFPGGLHEQRVAANTLQMDLGPSQEVTLQWATYADAADQAGQSRRWGGIHGAEDDLHGRVIGQEVGESAYQLVSPLLGWPHPPRSQAAPAHAASGRRPHPKRPSPTGHGLESPMVGGLAGMARHGSGAGGPQSPQRNPPRYPTAGPALLPCGADARAWAAAHPAAGCLSKRVIPPIAAFRGMPVI